MNATDLRLMTNRLLFDFPFLRKSYRTFRDAVVKAHQRKLQAKFLKDCLDNCIFPKTFLPQRLRFVNNNPFPDAAKELLILSIENSKVEVSVCFRKLRHSFKHFENVVQSSNSVSLIEFNIMQDYVYHINRTEIRKLKLHLMNKFETIFRNSPWVKYSNRENVVNKSSVPLTLDQLVVLGYGLSFALPPDHNTLLDFLTDFSKFEYRMSNNASIEDLSTLKGFMLNSIYRELRNGNKIPVRLHKAIQYLKSNRDLIICKADKGGKVVILDNRLYNNKMNDILADQTTYINLNNNPLKKWQAKYNKNLKVILKDLPDLEQKFKSYLPRLPVIYGLPKIHKENMPLRPIVSTYNSVNYKLSSWISQKLTPCLNKISNSHIVNTVDFINKLNNENLNNKTMVSFDVDSLFTSVPVQECIDLLSNELPHLNLDLPVPNNIFIQLIKLCTDDCYFSYGDKFFLQKSGLPMGSPLSPVLSNIFMEFFERNLLSTMLNFSNTIWFRYVDDVFSCLSPSINIDQFLTQLNTLHPCINFKYEIEVNNSLPFLDTLIIKDLNYSKPKFKVYRKPTHSNSYIHSFSHHSNNTKTGTIVNIFLRAYNICSPEFLNDEINYIFEVFKSLAFNETVIHRAHMAARKSFYCSSTRNDENDFSKVLILPPLHDSILLNSVTKNLEFKIVNRSSNTLRHKFSHSSINTTNHSVIYYIPCQSCPSGYIGESSDLNRRVYQHSYDKRNFNTNNAIVKHCIDNNHAININNVIILHKENDVNKRKLIESTLIHNNNNFNIQRTNYNLDILCNSILTNSIPLFNKLSEKIKNHNSHCFITDIT